MDGTFRKTTFQEHRKVKRTGRISALFVLMGIAVTLHVVLFTALDTFAPLGAVAVGDMQLEIQSDPVMQTSSADDADIERVIADAR